MGSSSCYERPTNRTASTWWYATRMAISAVGATWLDPGDDLGIDREPSAASRRPESPDVIDLRWAGSCSEDIVITVVDGNARTGLTLEANTSEDATTCRPRGFIHLMVSLWLRDAAATDSLELTDQRPFVSN